LVDEPELVSVCEVGGMHITILELKVAKADIGKVIGKQGRTAAALRTLLSAVSTKTKNEHCSKSWVNKNAFISRK
jgi:predicted RNA-binding protein YlqC (UPF0109 family)